MSTILTVARIKSFRQSWFWTPDDPKGPCGIQIATKLAALHGLEDGCVLAMEWRLQDLEVRSGAPATVTGNT